MLASAAAQVVEKFLRSSVLVLRLGDGVASLTAGAATSVFLDEYYTESGVMAQSLPLPVISGGGGSAGACALSFGTVTLGSLEARFDISGLPSLSVDGRCVVCVG